MLIEDYEADQDRKFALAPDVIEECQAIAELPEVDPDGW